jgi:glycosyltransferase involved in cell wall biosynthesis
MRIALSLIVKASDEEAVVLERCLSHAAPHVDGIFLTITGENAACEEVAKQFGATVSHFEWVHDFAKARNFALSQIPKDFTHWLWLDCDDVPRGLEKLRTTVDAHPEVDAFVMNYLYSFDEWKNPTIVHMKTRVLRHDGCVEWAGALHEDFKETRSLVPFFLDGIDILHFTDEARIKDSTARNVAVAERDLALKPDDPRSFWNVGNALRQAGEWTRALDAFDKFLALSQSDEEKYVIYLRKAETYFGQGDLLKALEAARMALGLRPNYPDAYHMAGHIQVQLKRYTEARDSFLQGLTMKPPYHSIIVYNPRDYDYTPLMALAKVYFLLSQPDQALTCLEGCLRITPADTELKKMVTKVKKEAKKMDKVYSLAAKLEKITDPAKLRKALDKVPADIQSHPLICKIRNTKLVKTESSGKDLSILCGYTTQEWTPETARLKGIGGSEEAVIHLAKRFVASGWNVSVYNNCGLKEQTFDGVRYAPYWSWNKEDKQDVTILWRHPRPVDYGINSTKVFLDLHDVIPAGELNEARLAKIDKIFVKSQAHRVLFPSVPDEKFAVIPNGIVWDALQQEIERDPYLLINTSSPDRSLSTLLDCFAEVKKQVPEAKLKWAYGWNVWDDVHGDNAQAQAWRKGIEDKMKALDGFENLGKLNHGEVAELYQKAGIFAYPTAFYEIDCISARKAQAGGAYPVVTDFAALNETVMFGNKVKTDASKENWGKDYATDFGLQEEAAKQAWIALCVEQLRNPMSEEQRKAMRNWTRKFDWEDIARQWLATF